MFPTSSKGEEVFPLRAENAEDVENAAAARLDVTEALVVNKVKSEVIQNGLDFQAYFYRPNSSIYMHSKNAKSSLAGSYIIIEFFS